MKLLSVVLLLTVCVYVSHGTTEGHNEDHEKGHKVGGEERQTERDEKIHEKGHKVGQEEGQSQEDTNGHAKGHTVVNEEGHTVGHEKGQTEDTKMGHTLVNEEGHGVGHEKRQIEDTKMGHTVGQELRQIEDNTKGHLLVSEEGHTVGHEKGHTEDTRMGHTLVNQEVNTVGHQKTDTVVNEEGNEEKHEMRHIEDTKMGHTLVNQEGHRVGHEKGQAELQEVEVEARHEVGARARHMKVVYGWSEVDYVYPDEKTRDNAIVDESYIPGNSLPISVDVDPTSGKVFITLPRIRPGVPASLAVVSEKKGFGEENMLVPYPSWAWHKQGDCEGITSVFRVFVDECRRLWVLDTGNVQDGDHDRRICPPQILIFDLNNDQIIKRYEFPDEVVFAYSLLVTIVVDVRDKGRKCRDSFAYIADVDGFGLVVYNHARDESWRVTANGMYPYPPFGLFDIHGTQFDLMDGILGLALTPKQDNVDRVLYFHALASNVEYWVETSLLRNKTNFPHGLNKVPRRFFMSPGKRTGQAAAESFDENRVLFFSSLPDMTINCWNSRRPYTASNLVAVDKDEEAFQFISGMKVRTVLNLYGKRYELCSSQESPGQAWFSEAALSRRSKATSAISWGSKATSAISWGSKASAALSRGSKATSAIARGSKATAALFGTPSLIQGARFNMVRLRVEIEDPLGSLIGLARSS